MQKTISLAAMLVLATAGSAAAGGSEGSVGVGAEFGINGQTGGVSVNYDAGKFHLGGFLGFSNGGGSNDTDYTLGGRFFYHINSTAMSDFGIGGTFGLLSLDDRGMGDRAQLMFLEPSFQIRLFLASNVALSFTAGVVIGLVDADDTYGFSIGAQNLGVTGAGQSAATSIISGAAGVHYYFD
jgi:hypothetical protein